MSYKVTCSVCGGEGQAHARHYGADWLGAQFTHKDPRACREVLQVRQERKDREELERREKARARYFNLEEGAAPP